MCLFLGHGLKLPDIMKTCIDTNNQGCLSLEYFCVQLCFVSLCSLYFFQASTSDVIKSHTLKVFPHHQLV